MGDEGYSDSNSDGAPKSGPNYKKAIGAAGSSIADYGQDALARVQKEAESRMPSYKRGGKVRKTGLAKLHKGEIVVPRGKVKRVKRALKKERKSSGRH